MNVVSKATKKTVTIPACRNHEGIYSVDVEIDWICPVCGQPRGEIKKGFSYDGSLRLVVDTWQNPCGHIDKYADVRREAQIMETSKKYKML